MAVELAQADSGHRRRRLRAVDVDRDDRLVADRPEHVPAPVDRLGRELDRVVVGGDQQLAVLNGEIAWCPREPRGRLHVGVEAVVHGSIEDSRG